MSFEVIVTGPFERKLNKLNRKYKSLKDDLVPIVDQLSNNPRMGLHWEKIASKSEWPFLQKVKVNLVVHD